MVNAVVDGFSKTLNHRKIIRKTHKNYWKQKECWNRNTN